MSLENFIITVFCWVVENVDQILRDQKLRLRGFAPKLTDAEVITMEIVGEFLGIDTDKGIWLYFRTHWHDWFPGLGSRSSFVRQASNLWQLKQKLQSMIARQLNAENDNLHLADGFPLPVCKFKRAYFSRVFKGLLFADKGLIGADFQQRLKTEVGINLQTPMRNNMDDPRGKDANSWLISTRRLVETVIGQLSGRFNIEKSWARDLWHFTNRIARKILSHTMATFINKMMGNQPLQFDNLLKP